MILLQFGTKIFKFVRKRFFNYQKIEQIDNGLPNFFDALKEHDIKSFLQDQEHFREYGYSPFESEQVDQLEIELTERKTGINLKYEPTM